MNYWYFPKDAPKDNMPTHVGTFDGQIDLNLKTGKYWEFRANPRGVVDVKDENRRRFLPQDIYADFVTSRFEMRAGYQVFSWKTVESVAHSDILNQTDPSLDFFDAPKVGEPALRTRFIIGDENPHTFEVYYLPYFTPAKLPIAGNRFDFSGALPQTTVGAQTITPQRHLRPRRKPLRDTLQPLAAAGRRALPEATLRQGRYVALLLQWL
jgi:hypothetical protein